MITQQRNKRYAVENDWFEKYINFVLPLSGTKIGQTSRVNNAISLCQQLKLNFNNFPDLLL